MHERKHPRLRGYDYAAQGTYFLTFCTQNRRCILSTVGRDDLGAPVVYLTEIGRAVDRYIQSIATAYPFIAVDCYVIMPNHVHLLLTVLRHDGAPGSSRYDGAPGSSPCDGAPGSSPCDGAPGSSRYGGAPGSSRPTATALIPRVIAALKRFTNQAAGCKLWQTSYYDHIIRDEADYTTRYHYILDNPRRWAEDEYHVPE